VCGSQTKFLDPVADLIAIDAEQEPRPRLVAARALERL
jgi:hypothetical protein